MTRVPVAVMLPKSTRLGSLPIVERIFSASDDSFSAALERDSMYDESCPKRFASIPASRSGCPLEVEVDAAGAVTMAAATGAAGAVNIPRQAATAAVRLA